MRRLHWLLAGLALAIGAGTVAQVVPGGLPSFPRFLGVTINAPSPSFNQLALNSPTGATNYMTFQAAGTLKAVLLNERTAGGNCGGDAVDDFCIRVAAGKLRVSTDNGASSADMSPADASVTFSLTTSNSNCTVNGTSPSIALHKVGKLVMGVVLSGGTCTVPSGTSLVSTNAPIPAAFRPTAAVAGLSCGTSLVVEAATNAVGEFCVNTSGNIVAQFTGTAVTSMGLAGGRSFVYTLD